MRKKSLLLCVFVFFNFYLFSQETYDISLAENLVIENGIVISAPGKEAQRATIIIKNGIITSVGTNLTIPANSKIIKADSFYIYPAFIDACSHTGIEKKESDKEKQPEIKDKANPGYKLSGITPQENAFSLVNMSDKSVEEMRAAGFAISHVVPKGGMIAGQSSIFLLSDNHQNPLLKNNYGLATSFQSASNRVYPSTVIAVIAYYKNIFTQSRNALEHIKLYEKNPIGLERPSYDAEITSLFPIIKNEQSLFFKAEKVLDISRAIQLKKELNLPMILVESKQSFEVIPQLVSNKITVLASLDIPESFDTKKVDTTRNEDLEYQALIKRKRESIESYQGNIFTLQENGIPYSFSYLGVKPKNIHEKLQIIRETGVSTDQLLEALTVSPSKILGIDQIVGTIEKGKLGNLVISNEMLFSKKSKILYTIVEGEIFEHKQDQPNSKNKEIKTFEGDWLITVEFPDSDESGTLKLKKESGEYTGILIYNGNESEIKNTKATDDKQLQFDFATNIDGALMKMTIAVERDKNTLTGTIKIESMGVFPVNGQRKPNN